MLRVSATWSHDTGVLWWKAQSIKGGSVMTLNVSKMLIFKEGEKYMRKNFRSISIKLSKVILKNDKKQNIETS